MSSGGVAARALVLGVLGVTGAATPAAADRREASLHAELVGGLASTGDPAAGTTRARAPIAGVALRAGYATHNTFQYDAALTLFASTGAAFASGTFAPTGRPPVQGPFTVATQAARLDGGVTLRLGVAWIPTVRLAGGLAVRHRGAPVVDTGDVMVSDHAATGRRGEVVLDLTGVAALGFDHRFDRHLIVGIAAGVSVAAPSSLVGGDPSFRTFEITIHAARYWYPR